MKIAIIGAGSVGKALGSAWGSCGHEVTFGVRPEKVASGARPAEESVETSVRRSEIVVLAVPWPAIPAVLADRALFAKKVVIDCTNPIAPDFSGLSTFSGGAESGGSAGEVIARLIPEAKVVKAFNTCGANVMADPSFPGGPTSMFVAGEDAEAKDSVMSLAKQIGFDPIDAGSIIQSRYLEAMAWLWISMAMKGGHGRNIAFKVMKR